MFDAFVAQEVIFQQVYKLWGLFQASSVCIRITYLPLFHMSFMKRIELDICIFEIYDIEITKVCSCCFDVIQNVLSISSHPIVCLLHLTK